MSLDLAALLPLDARAATLFLAALVGGLVRGFTGFGFAMVFVPVAAAAVGPAAAVGLIWVVDAPFSLWFGAPPPRGRSGARWCRCLPAPPSCCRSACSSSPISIRR